MCLCFETGCFAIFGLSDLGSPSARCWWEIPALAVGNHDMDFPHGRLFITRDHHQQPYSQRVGVKGGSS